MWPWSHAAVGYLCYSLGTRFVGRRPTAGPTAAVLFGGLLPDLVDKPLSWVFELVPQGYAVVHSVLVAIPLGIGAFVVARQRDRRLLGIAFIVGYWSHLLGDVVFGWLRSSPHVFGRVLWPVVTLPPYDRPVIVRLSEYVSVFTGFQTTDDAMLVILGAAVVYVTIGVWFVDGRPGLAPIRRALERSYDEPSE
ncbi:metal-dependent hydrolase [Halocatena pleomorpha]|uniref:Metal-dependent hydrolase n=1 Tax=Halocatena pleomorpha TaxID=1785090 RepID=A0A3P3REA6_9EURY|nr:metal-dependent hydrolase [Halocatena pleomorpha]RRJ31847.1 metal-dependent hydrolase [Halocatena pleomorpha]